MFGTWRHDRVSFLPAAAAGRKIGVALTVNATTGRQYYVNIGLEVRKRAGQSDLYEAYWSEGNYLGQWRWNLIRVPTAPDGLVHNYHMVRQRAGGPWDIYYEFLKVGTSEYATPEPVTLITGGLGTDAQIRDVVIPDVQQRFQYMDGGRVWKRFKQTEVGQSASTALCGGVGSPRPPLCFKGGFVGRPDVISYIGGKPGATPARGAGPVTKEVARVTAAEVQRDAAGRLGVRPADIRVRKIDISDRGLSPALRLIERRPVSAWVVTTRQMVRSFDVKRAEYRGATLEYDGSTGRLVHACLGSGCNFR